MEKIKRALFILMLLIELVLGFGVIIGLWLMISFSLIEGFVIRVTSITTNLNANPNTTSFVLMLSVFLVMGAYGIRALFSLFSKMVWFKDHVLPAQTIKRYLLLGIGGLLGGLALVGGGVMNPPVIVFAFIVAPPLLVTAHWIYLCRHYLWK